MEAHGQSGESVPNHYQEGVLGRHLPAVGGPTSAMDKEGKEIQRKRDFFPVCYLVSDLNLLINQDMLFIV